MPPKADYWKHFNVVGVVAYCLSWFLTKIKSSPQETYIAEKVRGEEVLKLNWMN